MNVCPHLRTVKRLLLALVVLFFFFFVPFDSLRGKEGQGDGKKRLWRIVADELTEVRSN